MTHTSVGVDWSLEILKLRSSNSVRSSMFIATEKAEHELRQEFHVMTADDDISLLTE